MKTAPAFPFTVRPVARLTWTAVAGLLALYLLMAVSAARQKGTAFDEGLHLTAGYNSWLHNDFRFDPANGDFVKRWAALPLLVSRPSFPSLDDPAWREGDIYSVGFKFFFQSGNDPAVLLAQGRAMVALLGVSLGLLVFACARELFGDKGGLLALTLFVFCPHMLAHGVLVSTDLPLSLALLASTWCIWRLLHEVTWWRLLLSLAALGLLLLSKMSAALIVPITGVMLAARLVVGGPLVWRLGRERTIHSRGRQAACWTGLIVMHVVFGWAALWAGYDFKYSARANPADQGQAFFAYRSDAASPGGPMGAIIDRCRRSHFLPEGYLYGVESFITFNEARPSFMNGHWKLGGWRTFFPYAFLVKTPPALFLLLPLGLAGWWWRRHRPPPDAVAKTAPPFHAATPFLALLAVYGAAAIAQNLNIGHRHILPLYPALYILAGSAALSWPTRAAWARITAALLTLWFVFDSLAIRPHYLAYFNAFAGGPAQGYRHLVDSSLDWGMDLPGLKQWLAARNPGDRQPFYLAYFGTGSPEHDGIRSLRLPGVPDWYHRSLCPLEPGFYAISATLLESVCPKTFGPWNRLFEGGYQETLVNLKVFDRFSGDPARRAALLEKYPQKFWDEQCDIFDHLRFGRLCAWLRTKRPPDDNVGYSILIWKLSQADLDAALFGPPAELYDQPADTGPVSR